MKDEELQTLLPLAAKAMGYSVYGGIGERFIIINHPCGDRVEWNPVKNVIDCAEMNATLCFKVVWHLDRCDYVEVGGVTVRHNGTQQDKMRAWMEASLRAAARVGERVERESGDA